MRRRDHASTRPCVDETMRRRGHASTRSGVDDHEEELGLAGELTGDLGPTAPLPRPRRDAGHLEAEVHGVARRDLATEAGPFDAAEQTELAQEPVVAPEREAAALGDRFDLEHAGQDRPAREVPGEERLVTGQMPPGPGRAARLQLDDLVHEQERRAVRKDVGRVRGARRPGRVVAHGYPPGAAPPDPITVGRAGARAAGLLARSAPFTAPRPVSRARRAAWWACPWARSCTRPVRSCPPRPPGTPSG